MSVDEGLEAKAGEAAAPESVKRKQILDGARRVFLGSGFAAASMGEIAREAKVSKGTLYVYFDSKEALFAALIDEAKGETAEHRMALDPEADVREVLTGFAMRLIDRLMAPAHIALVRMVIGISEKFPDLARIFYEAGPNHGRRLVTAYLEEQDRRGRMSVRDAEIAAWQFLSMVTYPVTVHMVLGGQPAPDAARIRAYAEAAVSTFLAGHARR
jgi:AcrR family transcriptional regulator